jgi:hypothetical protein
MTGSLTCFLRELLKAKNNDCRDSSIAKILIVDDNARLTPENRIKNTLSFASTVSGGSSSCCHLNSRWSSQPSLATSMKPSSSYIRSPRRNRSTGPCNEDTTTKSRNSNVVWNVIQVVEDDHSTGDSKLNAIIESAESILSSTNPLMSMNYQRYTNLSSDLVDVPQLPKRSTSQGLLQSRLIEKSKVAENDRGLVRHSLRHALGDMAPKSSLVERRSGVVGKKEFSQSTVVPQTSMILMDPKDHCRTTNRS